MPSHVYGEVDIAVKFGAYFLSFGMEKGTYNSESEAVEILVKYFTFDTRYEDDPEEVEDRPADAFAAFVSSGEGRVYGYELKEAGAYNQPIEKGGWQVAFEHRRDDSERLALTAMAYALLAEATRRTEEALADW